MSAIERDDLSAMAHDELARALDLRWRDLAGIVPWGDRFDGISPAGSNVTVERSYLWADKEGDDILCEVMVYGGESRWAQGAAASAVIPSKAVS